MTGIESLMQAATEVAQLAGSTALRHYRSALTVERKSDGSPVTVADREAEQAAREWIARRFPEDGFLGEESGVRNPSAARRWIVDPIDGTKSFLRGVPLWGSLVAVVEAERVLAGAACFPATGELVAAAEGCGCWADGSRARVSAMNSLSDATVLITDERFRSPGRRDRWSALAARAAVSRTWGDCYGYLLVATGRAEVMADDVVSAWDAAALVPIVTEAGGVITDWSGRATAFGGSLIATNAVLADEVRRELLDA
jgi:histidinol phosphatase-like enzyme (inositol monophosphatase family)